MRITKKIISLLLVVSMLASFLAMTGFEASAALTGQQKTDFGLHFDDTTRKFKVLQLSDIQTDHGDPNIAQTTKETIRMAMELYEPDLILLSGDQVQGGSSLVATLSQWKSSINAVFNTFTPYMKSGCKVIAVPGNHEYDFGNLKDQWEYYNSQSWYIDWDNNFSTIDLNGEPGAGNVTISARSSNKAVALNLAMFNSKGDDDDGYLRPGGDDNAAYQQIVDWYTNTNNTLASSAYSYKAQVTGKSSAYVPAFGMQHVILQEIYNSLEGCGPTDDGVPSATDGNYSALLNASYMKFKEDIPYSGILGEAPCPSTLGPGATTALYNALVNPGNFLGMCFGHDHLNTFDITDKNGFRFLMGGALTTENYNNGNPNVRYMEFTLDDATGEVDLRSELKSFNDFTNSAVADVAPDRIEAINGNGVQFVNTLSVPKTVYIGSKENDTDPRAVQKKGNYVQSLLLDYVTKKNYNQKLDVNFCLPAGATVTEFSVKRDAGNGSAVTMDSVGTETTSEGTLYKYKISTVNALSNGEALLYTVKYTTSDGKAHEIYSSSAVENIKMPAGYTDWFRSWRRSNNSSNYCDLHYVSTLSGANAYSFGRDTATTGDLTSNIHYNYSSPGTDVDSMWVNHNGDSFYSMYFWSPSRVEETSLISRRNIYASPQTDIYLDVSALKQIGSGDTRLDTGVRIDFWMPMNQGRGFMAFAAGIGFYQGDQDFVWNGATIDPNDSYSNYDQALDAEENSMSSGVQDDASVFLYNSYAGQQKYAGIGTTHINHNNNDDNKIGNLADQTKGWPLVVDSEAAALALNNVGMTMFTGVRVKGADSDGARQLNYAIAPFYLMFHTYDKGELRELTLAELMNPRIRSDYPNATDQIWDAYISAYKNAVACYAQTKSVQTDIDNYHKLLNDAIVALLNSNKGKPDESNLLLNNSKFSSIAVPPIIYVSGTTIQTAAPYTDRAITYTVPVGATNVSCKVVNANNDNVNSAVTTSTTNSGTSYTTTITGGTASAGGAIYYKLSYTLPEDKNKDGVNDTYSQYAASYVKAVPNKEGIWAQQVYRQRAAIDYNTAIYHRETLTMDNAIFSSRGVSGIMSLYGGVQGKSFDTTVVNGTTNEYTRYGDEGVYWSVGTAHQWPRSQSYAADGRVVFFNDRSRTKNNGGASYWNGLKGDAIGAGTINTDTNNTDEYIVANIYFDPQASGASVKPRFKLVMTTTSDTCNNPTMYQYWDANNYTAINYGGDYSSKSPNVSASGMFVLTSTGANNNWSSGNGITLNDGAVWETYIDANKSLNQFTAAATYSRLMVHGEKENNRWNNGIVGFAFVFNRVDKSKAHEAINWINGTTDLVAMGQPSALFVESEMDPAWWSQWRTEVMKAYVECGNLWDQKDYDQNPLISLWQNPIYKDADYSKLIAKINEITSANLTLGGTEHILDYNAINYKVNSGDDSRYVGNAYARTMYVNNAADLIATIKNRTSVYGDADKSGKPVNEASQNFHNAHLDIRFQGYIDDYVTALQQAWDKLRLQNADYTAFDKFTNYYNSTNDTILFMRDEYAGFNNDEKVRNDANEKNIQSAMFTAQSRDAFVKSLNIDRTLKKPSENAVVGSLPRIYPITFTYKNVASPDTTVCYYNTARDAYEGLQFRRAAEYYSADGTYTETYKDASGKTVSVTYYANYNKFDRGNSYYYTPVFSASNNSLTADITNGGYAVTDAKVAPTYNAGNTSKVPVTDGAGNVTGYVTMYTEASWGGNRDPYGFADAYVDNISDENSTYKTTNSKDKWVLAYYVESQICQQLASVDYFYDKLKENVADLTQLNIQKGEKAMYEEGTAEYNALADFKILDENGNVLTGGAQWYTADTWAEYIAVKQADGTSIPDGATLAEAQEIINTITQEIYNKRQALVLRPMEDYRVADSLLGAVTSSEDLLDMSKYDDSKPEQELPVLIPAGTQYPEANNFTAINNIIAYYNTVIGNQHVGVFGSRYTVPQDKTVVQGNALLYKKHYLYKEKYRTDIAGKYAAINGYAGKPMASNIQNYVNAVNEFKALFDQSAQNLNAANYSTLTMLLNKAWIPTYDTYGTGSYVGGSFVLGDNSTGANWYTPESWNAYYNARETAAKLYESNKGYDNYLGFTQGYGNVEAVGNLLVDSQGSYATNVDGSINKAAYDLLVAYYKLEYKKVSDFDGTISGLTGTYASINEQLDAMLLEKENETVDVVILNAAGQLETVKKSVYDPAQIALARTFKDNILALMDEDLGPNYSEYVAAVNNYKTVIDNLNAAPIYLDGWNGIIAHLNENAGTTVTIADSGTMTSYFNAVFTGFNPATIYAENGMSINNIFNNKAMYDGFGLTAKQGQAQYNALVTSLYNELHAASFVPAQVTRAESDATAKLNESTKAAYDPLQLNGRDKVLVTSKFTASSVAAAKAVVKATAENEVTLWNANPTVTGYNDNAGTVVDGTLADEIWATVGLTSESGDKDYDGANRDERYLLEEGGQFLDALNDAIEYANGELYGDDGEYKKFEIVNGAGEVSYGNLFTDESVEELVNALAAAEALTDTTSQDVIDQWVFDILENTDIDNKIKLTTAAGGFYGDLSEVAEHEGLKYSPADYTFFNEELGKIFEAESDGAWELVYQVWLDNGDGTFTLDNEFGSKYFTSDTWTPYQTAYLLATKADRNLTAKDQAIINAHTTEVHDTREALTWKGLDDSTQILIDSISAQIDSLSTTFVTVNTYTNSTVYVDENGNRVITDPSIGTVEISPYGDISEITMLWEQFCATYLQGDEIDITQQQQMLDSLVVIQDLLANLETKKFDVEDTNEFTIGVRNLVENFIAGSYTYNGIGSSEGVGTYTSDYLATTEGTNISVAEQNIRNAQQIAIQNKLNAIYTVLGSNYEVGDIYIDHSTGVAVRYETALDAVNALTLDLFGYLTGTVVYLETPNGTIEKDYTTVRAQYAGFALDMRQDLYDYLATEITIKVNYRQSATQPLYTKVVPLFQESAIESIKLAIDGNGQDNPGGFGTIENWPTINLLDDSLGIAIDETTHYDTLVFADVDGNDVLIAKEIVALVGGYSYLYGDAHSQINYHDANALMWLTNKAVFATDSEIYVLAQPADTVNINDAVFGYNMNVNPLKQDGDWYTTGNGININGSMYYLAQGEDFDSVTGSSYGGWFTDTTYEALMEQKVASAEFLAYQKKNYGTGPKAAEAMAKIDAEAQASPYGAICWTAENRDAFVNAIKDDQEAVDKATATMYQKICSLTLLKATDAYREVATLIYEALGLIPTWDEDNKTDIIIDGENVGETNPNPDGGRLFNTDLEDYLDDPTTPGLDYKIIVDENGNEKYYSTKLPTSYDGGTAAVERILTEVFQNELTNMETIDNAYKVTGDTNSVKSRIIAELEKLGFGLADLSKITSLTQAFLYNNPSNSNSLGSYDIDDNGVGEEFFYLHGTLGSGGNAFAYRDNDKMMDAGNAYHESGFYDFSKYTNASLKAVIEFLDDNDIINGTVRENANNFNISNKTGFDIDFDPTSQGGELYKTPATQQSMIDGIYRELVTIINNLELRKATTDNLESAIDSGNTILIDETLYDHEALDADGNNIWNEFTEALKIANYYVGVTVINETNVIQSEERLRQAIKALVLYVDTFAPVVTIHNTKADLNKFYAAHADELANTIPSADKMVTASYMTPNLGGYTLYVYTNQLNPQIVVSLKDTTSALNTDGSQRTVTTSKPEKMSVSAQAMAGVTANVIAPVHDVATGTALSSELVTLTGTAKVSTQTAKNADGGYDADSSAYLILSPQFADIKGTQQAAVYTIGATDSAIKKDAQTGEISSTANGATSFNYASNNELIETNEDGKITVFVYYMNAMPADGSDNGVNADGTVNSSAVLTYRERDNVADGKWMSTFGLVRTFHSSVKNWEFSDSSATLAEGAAYVDPTFGENNFGSFIYTIDPNATSGLDYVVAKAFFEEGEAAAKSAFIGALNSNSEYIATFTQDMGNADKFVPFGANQNWDQHLAFIDNGTLLFVHVADRFGNVCNRIVQVNHYDQLKPELEANGAGKVTVTEPGGSGVATVDLFNYMGTQGSSLYIDYLFDMLHVDDFTYVSSDNTFTIKTGAANAGKLFTVAVTDHAGNVGSVPVNADANGDIVLTVDETYNNVVKYKADTSDVSVNTGEDLEVIEFVFNNSETIKLNFIEPSSIVKAGPDGNVFAKQKGEPLSIVVKSGVEAIKLYNVDNGTEEIWTADKATVKDNGDGTSTWTVKYTFTEGTHNYTATAKVDGAWEITPVAFSFVATTKSVEVKLIVAGIGKIRFGYNEGSYSNVPVMSKKIVPYGSVVTLEAVQTEAGSDFYYWTNNSSNRIISASAVYKFTAVTDMDLTSQFTTNECFDSDKKLVVYVNNAENLVENFELAEGEDYKVPAAPSLPEHVFKEWSMTKEEILASDEKMIIVRPVYSLVVKNTVTLTEGNWTTTGAGVYESVDNDRALVSISASATNAAGESFLYWIDAETGDIASYNRSYTFHAIKDTELTPVYGDASAVVPVPVARISTAKYDSAAKKVNFYAERSIPAGYDLIQTGIIVTKTASVGTDEDAFVLGASGVGKGLSNSTAANGYYAGAVSATAGTVVYARAYVIYQNADGDIITDYSTIASYNA